MFIKLSEEMQRAVEMAVRTRIGETAIVDVSATAEEVRQAFEDRNVAHEDIAASVAHFAAQCGYPIELAGRVSLHA